MVVCLPSGFLFYFLREIKYSPGMKMLETEVCAYSLESCQAARQGGATRVELCSGPAEGGTTPSAAAIILARKIPGIQLSVMIRPRGGDFLYSKEEYEEMKINIQFARECGADGVVLGILTPEGKVDVKRTSELVSLAGGMAVTFHRAFDMTQDWREALEDIISTGCCRILTSGCRNTAPEGLETLREIVQQSAGRIQIMAGSGVKPANAAMLADSGVDALHFSARTVRDSGMEFRNPLVSMGGTPSVGEYEVAYADVKAIREIVDLLKKRI